MNAPSMARALALVDTAVGAGRGEQNPPPRALLEFTSDRGQRFGIAAPPVEPGADTGQTGDAVQLQPKPAGG